MNLFASHRPAHRLANCDDQTAMCILTYVSTLAVSLLTLWFPVPCIGQIAIPLTTSLPLEVRSPYINFWTHSSNTSSNTTTESFARAVRHVNSPPSSDPLTYQSTRCVSFASVIWTHRFTSDRWCHTFDLWTARSRQPVERHRVVHYSHSHHFYVGHRTRGSFSDIP